MESSYIKLVETLKKNERAYEEELIFVKWQRDDLLIKLTEVRDELKSVKLHGSSSIRLRATQKGLYYKTESLTN